MSHLRHIKYIFNINFLIVFLEILYLNIFLHPKALQSVREISLIEINGW